MIGRCVGVTDILIMRCLVVLGHRRGGWKKDFEQRTGTWKGKGGMAVFKGIRIFKEPLMIDTDHKTRETLDPIVIDEVGRRSRFTNNCSSSQFVVFLSIFLFSGDTFG